MKQERQQAEVASELADQMWEAEFAKMPGAIASAVAMLLLAKSIALPAKSLDDLTGILPQTVSAFCGLAIAEFAEKEEGRRSEH